MILYHVFKIIKMDRFCEKFYKMQLINSQFTGVCFKIKITNKYLHCAKVKMEVKIRGKMKVEVKVKVKDNDFTIKKRCFLL